MNARSFVHLFVVAVLAVAGASAPPRVAAETDALNGKAFVADAGLKGKSVDEKGDVITFRDGKFHSSMCDQWGFGTGDYKAIAAAEAISFETETFSEKDGRLAWKGIVKGDTIEGQFTHYRKARWYDQNPAPIEHWFKGKLRP